MAKNFISRKKEVLKAITEAEERALYAIGEFVTTEAKVRCPVGQYNDGRVGGNLRDSIDNKVIEKEKAVVVGTSVEYAVYVEKGTKKQRAQPYLTPAVEENINKIKKLAKEMMKIND